MAHKTRYVVAIDHGWLTPIHYERAGEGATTDREKATQYSKSGAESVARNINNVAKKYGFTVKATVQQR